MLKNRIILILVFLSISTFWSCSEYQKLLKSSDYDLKYEKSIEYYEDGDYYRSLSLLEELITFYRGTDKAENIAFYYAYCHYHQREYLLASYHFKNFANTFPNSEHTEECVFLSAYCFYLRSPNPSLDQTETNKAIESLQLYINKYPLSERIGEANELIEILHHKLETKSYNNSKLYYKLGYYSSAIIAINNTLKDFPDTEYREELLFILLKSQFDYAENSVISKQKERYEYAIEKYYALLDAFPNSSFLKEAEHIYDKSAKIINR